MIKNVSRNWLASSLLASSLAFSTGAQALPTVDIAFSGNLFPAGSDSLTFNFGNGSNSRSARVNAAMFGGAATNGVDFDPASLYKNAKDVLFYCVDIIQHLRRSSTTYNVNDISKSTVVGDASLGNPRRDFARTLDFLGAVNFILQDTYSLDFGDKNWLNPSSGWMSGAIQVGIWESLYETEGASLAVEDGSGNFFVSRGLNRKAGLLSLAFDDMSGTAALDSNQVKWFSTEYGQDLIADPASVPLPATLALIGLGLAGIGYQRRKVMKVT